MPRITSTNASDLIRDVRVLMDLDDNSHVETATSDALVHTASASQLAVSTTQPATEQALAAPATAVHPKPVNVRAVAVSRQSPVYSEDLRPYDRVQLIEAFAEKDVHEHVLRTIPWPFSSRAKQQVKRQAAVAETMLKNKLRESAGLEAQLFAKYLEEFLAKKHGSACTCAPATLAADAHSRFRREKSYSTVKYDVERETRALKDELSKYYGNVSIWGSRSHKELKVLPNGDVHLESTIDVRVELEGLRFPSFKALLAQAKRKREITDTPEIA